MEKLDLRKQYKRLYSPSAKKVELVDVPPLQFAMIDGVIPAGQGVGESAEFSEALNALYGISYTLKFMFKKRDDNPIDYPVMALEGLWGTESGMFDPTRRETWLFTAMIMQPDIITPEIFAEGIAKARLRKPSPAFDRLRLETFHEGPSIQVMHVGPYATEPETIARMDAFAAEHGYTLHGRHHEIYMGDPRRAAPEKLKTVLRHPVLAA
ncbi:GyrI-like domain-containing protein [Promineifilum sp.]|uniref:GyrI-like domain-containing protein n=1 Tax=Promineifilum sp. TaxID=2664178 RepID=UPI0035B2078B